MFRACYLGNIFFLYAYPEYFFITKKSLHMKKQPLKFDDFKQYVLNNPDTIKGGRDGQSIIIIDDWAN